MNKNLKITVVSALGVLIAVSLFFYISEVLKKRAAEKAQIQLLEAEARYWHEVDSTLQAEIKKSKQSSEKPISHF